MITVNKRRKVSGPHQNRESIDQAAAPGIRVLTAQEGIEFYDHEARKLFGISGEEFLRRWDAGEYGPVPDTVEGRKLGRLVMLMPLARPTED